MVDEHDKALAAIIKAMVAKEAAAQTKRMRRTLEIIATLNEKTTTVEHARNLAITCLRGL